MKKIILSIFSSLFIISCSSQPFEINSESIISVYQETDRSINLENQNISGFISLNEVKPEQEVNNIFLQDNAIDILNISEYSELGKLDISNNNIRFISDLKLPLEIRHLDISRNNITSLEGIERYTNLKTLNISDNQLSYSDIEIISNLENLIFIKADNIQLTNDSLFKIAEINNRFLMKNSDPFIK